MSYCKFDELRCPVTPVEVQGNTFVMPPRLFAEKHPRRAKRTARIINFPPEAGTVNVSHCHGVGGGECQSIPPTYRI